MAARTHTAGRLGVALTLTLLVPVALGAQQQQQLPHQQHHNVQDSTGARHGQPMGMRGANGMMGMQGMMGTQGMMGSQGMMGRMQGNYMMGMVSTMQLAMRFQPAQILTYADTLKLSEAQVSQIQTIETKQSTGHQERMQAMIDRMGALNEALEADDPDLSEIRTLADTALTPYHAMAGWMVLDAARVKKLLTPSQREAALDLPLRNWGWGMGTMMQGYHGGYDPGK
jgi:Spy/CpxP family protein refolding chaperone